MSSEDGTSDGLGREQHARMKSLGKATQENKTSAALESLSGREKNRNPNIPSTQNVAQNLNLVSKGKQALQDSKDGHDSIDQNKQSSASWSIRSFQDGPGIFPSSDDERIIALEPLTSSKKKLIQNLQETDSQNDGPDTAQSNLESDAPAGSTAVEPNADPIVAVLGEAPNAPPPALAVVASNIAPRRVAPVQPDVAPHAHRNGAPPAPAQPNAPLIVAPARGVAPVQPDVAPHAHRNGAPPAPAQPNAPLIVAPARRVAPVQPDVAPHAQRNGAPALAQPNAPLIGGPPAVGLDENHGLNRSRLKPLRICEIGSEGHFWPKL